MISRRRFLACAAAVGAAHFFAGHAFAAPYERRLDIRNIHTDERLEIRYFQAGEYDWDAVGKINYALRCHNTDEVKAIDIRVIDLLSDISEMAAPGRQAKIISGYRSPSYNNHLISLGRKVVGNSMHLSGQAIDFAIEGLDTVRLFRAAGSFGAGGVGRYPDFVHIDVGRVRYW
ncbi:MAG: DUF882 domain-containing protein [Nitrospirae bacterium]|nr:DUF882 domain-containing protein [Nitrospirota bacterium]